MDKRSNEAEKKPKGIEVGSKRMVLLSRLRPAPEIAVIDRQLQKRFPTLLVSPTQTVRIGQVQLLRDSEPKMQHDK